MNYPEPPEHLRDAWARYQAGEHVGHWEGVKLDEWRADVEREAFESSDALERSAFDLEGIKAALEGSSNDSEHDALVQVAEVLGIEWDGEGIDL